MLKDVFGFAEHQEKATYGLSYKITSTMNINAAALNKGAGSTDAKIVIDEIHWYVPHYTPSIPQQALISNI